MTEPVQPVRISSAVACAIAASRAQAACESWALQLDAADYERVAQRLRLKQEWIALSVWERVKPAGR